MTPELIFGPANWFAMLGWLSIHGQPGNLPAVTGAAGMRVLGSVTPA